jgi:hypothetical protein
MLHLNIRIHAAQTEIKKGALEKRQSIRNRIELEIPSHIQD